MWILCKQEGFCLRGLVTFSVLVNTLSFSWLVFISISRGVKAWGYMMQGRVVSTAETIGKLWKATFEIQRCQQLCFIACRAKHTMGQHHKHWGCPYSLPMHPFWFCFLRKVKELHECSLSHAVCLPVPRYPALLGPNSQQCCAELARRILLRNSLSLTARDCCPVFEQPKDNQCCLFCLPYQCSP